MQNLTILAIDDDKDILSLVALLLKKKNHKVIQANSGEAALAILQKTKPDIILLDVIMKNMSGYEVCRHIYNHDNLSFIPVIFLTALSSEKIKAKAFSLGAVDFLTKPIEKERLYSVIDKHADIENKWRRFLQHKEGPLHGATGYRKAAAESVSFSKFRIFLFEFLDIPKGERDRLESLNTGKLAEVLQDTGRLTQNRYSILMSQFTGFAYLSEIEPERILLDTLPLKFSKHYNVISISTKDGFNFVVTDPFNSELLNILRNMKPDQILITAPEVVAAAYGIGEPENKENLDTLIHGIKALYSGNISDADQEIPDKLVVSLNASPLVRFVNTILEQAFTMGASDIHIEPQEQRMVVRFRIDGELIIVQQINPRGLINVIISRIKILAQMDISEKRLPQDGRFSFKHPTRKSIDFDVRVSSAPVNHGEKVVMRILNKKNTLLPFEKLGFSARSLRDYRQKLKSPFGMILHVGPTGSGKSMSLYSALNEINRPNINIMTAEDPIEYTLNGINQMQVKPSIGLTFENALRCFLRQDPDVILVGEIRDRETAITAVEASLTGHLIFSTLHTNDAASTVIRFIEMGIPPYLLSSSIVLICAQRLLRRLCTKCRTAYTPEGAERKMAGLSPGSHTRFYRPTGCPACHQTGYKGRIGVYELLIPNTMFREVLMDENISTEKIRQIAVDQCGMTSLFNDAMEKVQQGIISMEEAVSKTKIL